jgi:hypothetical protein
LAGDKFDTETPTLAVLRQAMNAMAAAIFLVLTSSKRISSVVMSRILGVNQKTA